MGHWFDALAASLAGPKAPAFSVGWALAPLLGTAASTKFAAGAAVTLGAQPVADADLTGPFTLRADGSAVAINASATGVLNGQTVTYAKTVTKSGPGAGRSASRSTISIGGKSVLEVNATSDITGPAPRVQVSVRFAGSATATASASLFSDDGRILQGTINGKRVLPFSIRSDAGAVKFSDGTAMPSTPTDAAVAAAVDFILGKAKAQTAATYAVADTVAPVKADLRKKLKPGHGSNPQASLGCIGCEGGCAAAGITCALVAAGGCTASLFFYPVCIAIAEGACAIAEILCVSACHNTGAPCCPVGCGDGCCDHTEICLDDTRGVCCSEGTDTCARVSCCAPTDQCITANGTCCPKGQVICANQCCDPGEICQNNSVCCPKNQKVCGTICCPPNHSCVNGKCCPDQLACGKVCCDELSTCADAATGLCCGFASVVCGSVCCPPGSSCIGGKCCPGNSVCGGVCCPNGETCLDAATHKCQPCPKGLVACSPDPAGPGLCCPPGHSCCNGACCPNASDICCDPPQHAGGFACNPISNCIQ